MKKFTILLLLSTAASLTGLVSVGIAIHRFGTSAALLATAGALGLNLLLSIAAAAAFEIGFADNTFLRGVDKG
jgi:O-antigen/teichoic acid export membrane protein